MVMEKLIPSNTNPLTTRSCRCTLQKCGCHPTRSMVVASSICCQDGCMIGLLFASTQVLLTTHEQPSLQMQYLNFLAQHLTTPRTERTLRSVLKFLILSPLDVLSPFCQLRRSRLKKPTAVTASSPTNRQRWKMHLKPMPPFCSYHMKNLRLLYMLQYTLPCAQWALVRSF